MSIVEKMARAICADWGYDWDGDPDDDQTAPETNAPYDDRPSKGLYRTAAASALTATGLTEAQIEGLATGAMVMISRQSLTEMHAALISCDEDGMTEHAECMVEAGSLVNRAMLAAKDAKP